MDEFPQGFPIMCVKTNNGIYVNRVEFIDMLERIDATVQEVQKKRWWQRKKVQPLLVLIRLMTAFGEPPNAEDGDGGELAFNDIGGRTLPPIQWKYCEDAGVCLRIVDLLLLYLPIPLSDKPLKVVMSCLLCALGSEFHPDE
ncbi:MAG: hypothetical protein M0R80_07595 [Proteobacteria bacterium]|nr:hypothetical protein [Pseudomonadota bacterium]